MNDPVLSVRIKNDKEGPQTGDVVLNGSAVNEWATGNTYDIGDVVVYENQFYQSLEDQTAEASFDYDKWEQIGIPDIIVNEFQPNTHYAKDEVITYEDKLYKAKEEFTSSSSFYLDDWVSISGETYTFTSEDRTVTITINDSTVDFSVSNYVTQTKENLESQIGNKVDKVEGKGLSTNDYTAEEKTKLQSLVSIFSIGDNLVLDDNGRLNAGFSVSFDPALDKNSTNGIQNKPVAEAVEALQDVDIALGDRITTNTNNITTNRNNIATNTNNISTLQTDVNNLQSSLNDKVDKVDGKDLSSNDYTDADQTKLNNLANIKSVGQNLSLDPETGELSAPEQIILESTTGSSTSHGMTQKAITDAIIDASTGITSTLAAVATSGDYADLNNTPAGETLTIQKNGAAIGTFSTLSGTDETINITVPATAADIGALPASTKYAADLNLSINSSTFVMTAQLVDQTGNALGTQRTIDLPLESVVVNGRYDSSTKKVILTLQSGSTVEFSIADLIDGLQSEITDYTAGKQYIVGDICILDGSFYRCINPIASAPATFNESDWEQVGGADAIVINTDRANSTWSGVTFAELSEALGTKLVIFKNGSASAYGRLAYAWNIESSSITIETLAIMPAQSAANKHLSYYHEVLNSNGTYSYTQKYVADGDSDGKASQTVGTLTIEKSDHTSIGTFNGSSDQTITLPESFEVLTNAEIDTIWENA